MLNLTRTKRKKNVDDLAIATDELTESNKRLLKVVKDARKDLQKTDDELTAENKTRQELTRTIQNGSVVIARNKDQISKNRRERRTAIKAITGEKTAFDKLSDSLEENSEQQKANAKNLKDLGGRLESLPGPVGNVVGGFQNLIQTAKAFILTPLGAILTALIGTLGLLRKAFLGTEANQNKLKRSTAELSGAYNLLLRRLRETSEGLFDTISKEIDDETQKLRGLSKAFGEILRRVGFEKAAESVQNFNDDLDKSIDKTEQLIEAEIRLTKAQRVAEKTQLDFQRLAEKARQIRDDERIDINTRIQLNQELGRILRDQSQAELKIANEALKVAKFRIEVEGESVENLDARAEALTRISDINERIEGQESEQLININSLTRENIQLQNERIALLERESELVNEELERADEIREKELEDEFEFQSQLTDIEIEGIRKRLEAEEAAAERRKQIQREIASVAIDIAGVTADAIFQIASNNIEAEKNAAINAEGVTEEEKLKIQKDAAKKQKQIAIIQAVINGALAVVRAFADLGPIGGAISAALIAATTAAQIAVINSQQFAKGGEIKFGTGGGIRAGLFSGPSHSGGGIGMTLDNGQRIEAEGDEGIYVVNKRDNPAAIAMLSAINSLHGKAFSTPVSFAQDGGELATQTSVEQNRQIEEAISRLVVVTRVTDINNTQAIREQTINNGIINA